MFNNLFTIIIIYICRMCYSKCLNILLVVLFLYSCSGRETNSDENTDDQNGSISFLQKQVARYPDSLSLAQNLIQAYRMAGNYDSAISFTKRLVKKDTGDAYLWNIIATLSYENEDTMAAINAFQKAASIYPLPDYFIALGTIYAEKKDTQAIEIANTLLEHPESNSVKDNGYFIKGLYYNYTNQPDKALSVLDSALKINFTFMFAYREKAIALYELRNYKEAIRVLKKAVTLQNSFDEGYYWMGRNYEKLNEKDSAIQSYQNALLYDKNFIEAREALDSLTGKKN